MPEENKGKRLKAGGLVVALFMLLYIPSLIHWLQRDNIVSDIIRVGIIEESINTDGLLVRDEVPLNSPAFEGKFIPEVSEGEKVPAFFQVATVSNKTTMGLIKELEDVNLKIIQAQNEKAKKANFFSDDIVKIDKVIGQRVQDIISVCNNNSMTDVSRLKSEVNNLIEKKAEIAGAGSSDKNIDSLKQQRNAVQERINASTSRVVSEYSGIISFSIDGFEQVLTPKALDKLTPKLFEEIRAKVVKKTYDTGSIEAGKPFAKVIRGVDWYMAAELDTEKAMLFKAGDAISLRINDIGTEIPAVISGKSEKSDGKYIVWVKIDRCAELLSASRMVNADLIKSSQEGLKVPLKCLSMSRDGKKADIMLIKANVAAKRMVDIISEDGEFAIIKTPENEVKATVSLYDTYILNPGNIKEGQIINK